MARARTNHRPIDQATNSVASNTDNLEAVSQVRAALETLPASGREVILLHYYSGLTYEEISQALGITPQSVHGRLQRARSALARELSKADE
jgi:RNA polymerase sigma-70 factor (ECF subfamily)